LGSNPDGEKKLICTAKRPDGNCCPKSPLFSEYRGVLPRR